MGQPVTLMEPQNSLLDLHMGTSGGAETSLCSWPSPLAVPPHCLTTPLPPSLGTSVLLCLSGLSPSLSDRTAAIFGLSLWLRTQAGL